MALRPYVHVFDLQKFRALFGSGNEAAKASATVTATNMYSSPDEIETRQRCIDIIQRGVSSGVPFPDLDAEQEVHVIAAVALSQSEQELVRPDTDDDSWRISLLEDLVEENAFDGRTKELLVFLKDGRPIFGRKIATGWSYYAYLSIDEVRELAEGIRRAQEEDADLADPTYFDGFLLALLGWLDKIADRKMDYGCIQHEAGSGTLAAPTGGPVASVDNSNAPGGPPSVS